MLVLRRKTGETIRIGVDVTLQIRRVSGNRVVLAINAPRNVRILRGELRAFDDGFIEEPNESLVMSNRTDSLPSRPIEYDPAAMV